MWTTLGKGLVYIMFSVALVLILCVISLGFLCKRLSVILTRLEKPCKNNGE